MRPERAVVKKALSDAPGNLSRAAALLGCTRQTLYTWCYQLGLERMAGIRPHTQVTVDREKRMDEIVADTDRSGSSGVKSARQKRPILSVVEQAAEPADLVISATVKIRESVWKRLKIQAIEERTTMGAIVERALDRVLEPRPARRVGGAKQQA